jgi:hypothetical protein
MLKIGKNHFNSDRIVNVVSPAAQGQQTGGAKVVLAGSEDVFLFGEDAEAMREWLASQCPAPKAVVTTKAEPSKATK